MLWTFNPFTGKLDQTAASGGGGGNPFNQNLNTTDSVSFSGIGNGTTSPIRKYHQEGGKFLVNSNSGSYGQFQFINPDNAEASFVIANNSYPNEDGSVSSNSDDTHIWGIGIGMYGNYSNIFTIGNAGSGEILTLTDGFGATISGNLTASGEINGTNIGTAAAKSVPTSGNATSTQVVLGSDTRLTDSRTPAAHTHPLSALTQSSATNGQVATWNGTAWAAATPASSTDASALTTGTLADARLSSNVVTLTGTQTLTNKSISSGQITGLATVATSGSAADLTGTLSDSRLSSNVVTLTGTQTLTNKTLTTPNVGNGTTNAILTSYTANILSVANSTTACGFSIFNTRTDASNSESAVFDFTTTANTLTIGTAKLGSGTLRNVVLTGNQVDIAAGGINPSFRVRGTSYATVYVGMEWVYSSLSADPTTTDVPNGRCRVIKNTTSGVLALWANDAGTIKKVTLT
jgi:hypothetical protein